MPKHRLCHGADPQLHPIDRLVDACAEQSLFKIQAQVARGSNPKRQPRTAGIQQRRTSQAAQRNGVLTRAHLLELLHQLNCQL